MKPKQDTNTVARPISDRLSEALARETAAVAAVGEAAQDAVAARLGAAAIVAEAAEALTKRQFAALCKDSGVAKPEDYLRAHAQRDVILDRLNGQVFLPFTATLLEPPKERAEHVPPAVHRADVLARAAEVGKVRGFDFAKVPDLAASLELRLKNTTADLRGALQSLTTFAERVARGEVLDETDIARLRQVAAKAEGAAP